MNQNTSRLSFSSSRARDGGPGAWGNQKYGGIRADLDAIARKVKNAIQNIDEGETYEN